MELWRQSLGRGVSNPALYGPSPLKIVVPNAPIDQALLWE